MKVLRVEKVLSMVLLGTIVSTAKFNTDFNKVHNT
jgi:hypothetical protein